MLTDLLCSLSLCHLFLIINVPLLILRREHKLKHGHEHEHEHEYEYVMIEFKASQSLSAGF